MPELPPFELASPGPLRDALVGAVLSGAKTGTSSLLLHYDREPLPTIGARARLVDSAEATVGVVLVTAVAIVRLADVDLNFAISEGEGYRSVAEWRAGHDAFWASLDEPQFPADDAFLVIERFLLVDRAPVPGGP